MTEPARDNPGAIEHLLAQERASGRRRRLLLWTAVAVAVALAAALALVLRGEDDRGLHFETAEVRRGDLTVKVTATGTLEPVNQVEVGTEVSGTIESVEVDYNEHVERGQVLARLDTDRLEALVIEARASLAAAEAQVREAEATVLETRLRAERCSRLAERQMCSLEELDTQQAAAARAQAAEANARAGVELARAALGARETDLTKAVIRAPIAGIVLKREIEPGQTVAASLQTPLLFLLAENLTQMELHVAVDEADVGRVAEGQEASFTVDAFPDRIFPAEIEQVRFAPETVEGVVTYETLLTVDNSDLALRPGMTATADIIARRLEDVLLVPNAALRFTPPARAKAPDRAAPSLLGRLFPRPGHSQQTMRRPEGRTGGVQQVWRLEDGEPLAVDVRVGATDGLMTELVGDALAPGTAVLVDVAPARQ
ncbi:MAG: efflux RND transporter periplasmic adaptor subunit [Chromatiales bacterium]|jgi:HlyD family secretion protein